MVLTPITDKFFFRFLQIYDPNNLGVYKNVNAVIFVIALLVTFLGGNNTFWKRLKQSTSKAREKLLAKVRELAPAPRPVPIPI